MATVLKQYFVIETLEQLKTVSDPLRIRLLTFLVFREATGSQLANEMQMPAANVHYHLRELQAHGFLEVVRTEVKNGIIQKFYRATAIDFVLREGLLPSGTVQSTMMQEIMASQLRMAVSRVYETDERFFKAGEGNQRKPLIHGIWEISAPREKLLAWHEKYRRLMKELSDLEEHSLGESSDGELFFIASVGFLTDVKSLQVDESDSLSADDIRIDPCTGEAMAHKEEHPDADEH